MIGLLLIMFILLMIPLGSALAGGAVVFILGAKRISGRPRRMFITAVIGSAIGYVAGLIAFGFVFIFCAHIFEDGANVLDPWTAGDSLMMVVIFLDPAICSAICVACGFHTGTWLARLCKSKM